jgi:hypothetical protein
MKRILYEANLLYGEFGGASMRQIRQFWHAATQHSDEAGDAVTAMR